MFDPTAEPPKLLVLTSSTDVISRQVTTVDGRLTLSSAFETVVIDIFNRFDQQGRKTLGYGEFCSLCNVIERDVSEQQWHEEVLSKVQST
jgi:hypothetical protein